LRLPLTEFFCRVLEYFQVHISRLNPFGYAKLTTFVVMCKAYGCEPSLDLFRGFFNLCRVGKWLTFAKRSERHITNLLPKVITRIEGWHERFYYVLDSIIPAKYSQLLSEQKKLDLISFKDKIPPNIEENPMFQCLSRYLTNVCVFLDPILFWLASNLRRNMSAVTCDHGRRKGIHPQNFGIGSPSALVNTKPPKDVEDPKVQFAKVTADSRESPKASVFVVHPRSVSTRIKERKYKTKEGSSRPPVKGKLAFGSSSSCVVRTKTSTFKDDALFLSISDDDEELLDLHECCYTRQAVVDNAFNRRAREFLQVNEKMSGEADIIKARERSRKEECEGLQVKCEDDMAKLDQNPTVLALQEKISSLTLDVKEYKASLHREVEVLKKDRSDVVSKVIPYAAMDLLHSDELGRLVGKCHSFDWNSVVKEASYVTKACPSRTQMPVPSSQKATLSSALSLYLMSPPVDLVKPPLSLLD
nr:hypothetical protein [Tanacetum cinerariifolium]GEV85665.1 hypothetical protein [Tanacetum cinerariifolium]